MLYCIECGCCSGELGKGRVALRCTPEEGAEPEVAIRCPVCAAAEFGFRDAAANYMCASEPMPGRIGRS